MANEKNGNSTASKSEGAGWKRWWRRLICVLSIGFVYPNAWAEGIDFDKYEKDVER